MGLLGTVLGSSRRVQFIQNNNTVVQFDASIKENHSKEAVPTEFPVENGQTISDHIIVKPFTLELTGIISDTPIGTAGQILTEVTTTLASYLAPPAAVQSAVLGVGAAAALFKALSGSKSPSVAAYAQLIQLQANALPVTVITTLYRYTNMWIKSITAPRDADTGQALLFTVSLVQLLLVSPSQVNIAVFSNPALSASLADLGEKGISANGFTDGVNAATSDLNSIKTQVTPGGLG